MSIDPTRIVCELALEIPNATRVFEKAKIDYCCGGNRALGEACARAGVEVGEIARLLNEPGPAANGSPVDFQSLSLRDCLDHIVEKHHRFARDEAKRLTGLLDKVCSAHGANHPELFQIQSSFGFLQAELEPHMFKEERVLFPFIAQLEAARAENRAAPRPPFGTMRNPLAAMTLEHDLAGGILRDIRKLSRDFTVPEDACISYRTLYGALEEFEADLHEHIHLENNILFPRALKLEDRTLERTGSGMS
jgi:regulator of cell morphogenesis and NO signaling